LATFGGGIPPLRFLHQMSFSGFFFCTLIRICRFFGAFRDFSVPEDLCDVHFYIFLSPVAPLWSWPLSFFIVVFSPSSAVPTCCFFALRRSVLYPLLTQDPFHVRCYFPSCHRFFSRIPDSHSSLLHFFLVFSRDRISPPAPLSLLPRIPSCWMQLLRLLCSKPLSTAPSLLVFFAVFFYAARGPCPRFFFAKDPFPSSIPFFVPFCSTASFLPLLSPKHSPRSPVCFNWPTPLVSVRSVISKNISVTEIAPPTSPFRVSYGLFFVVLHRFDLPSLLLYLFPFNNSPPPLFTSLPRIKSRRS